MCAKQQLGVVLDGCVAGEEYHDLGKEGVHVCKAAARRGT